MSIIPAPFDTSSGEHVQPPALYEISFKSQGMFAYPLGTYDVLNLKIKDLKTEESFELGFRSDTKQLTDSLSQRGRQVLSKRRVNPMEKTTRYTQYCTDGTLARHDVVLNENGIEIKNIYSHKSKKNLAYHPLTNEQGLLNVFKTIMTNITTCPQSLLPLQDIILDYINANLAIEMPELPTGPAPKQI